MRRQTREQLSVPSKFTVNAAISMQLTRWAALLGLIAGLCKETAATCRGGLCEVEKASAGAHGLLGANAACPNKSYTWPHPPVETEGPILEIQWASAGGDWDKYAFAITRGQYGFVGGPMWRSTDYGQNWKDITQRMIEALPSDDPDDQDKEGVIELHYHWSNSSRLLFQGPGFHLWTSEDLGESFEAHETPGGTLGFWMEIRLHPVRPEWMLARVRRNVCLHYDGDVNKWCANDLFLSQDFAKTWTNLTEKSNGKIAAFWDFDWGANMLGWNRTAGYQDETILATVYEDPEHMKGPYPGWDKDLHFVVSHDFFETDHERIATCGNQFEIISHKIYLAMPENCPVAPDGSPRKVAEGSDMRNSVALFSSSSEDMTFVEIDEIATSMPGCSVACLPTTTLDKGYNLVRTHDGHGVFAIVDHDERDAFSALAPIGSVYASGWNTSIFTFSMARNYRRSYLTDFTRVEWLPGAYLANQLHSGMFEDPEMMRRAGKSYEDFIQTKISTNGGAQWNHLNVPETYRHPSCNQCAHLPDPSKCRLHLHGPSDWHSGPGARPSFYTHWNAPGYIMSSGNTGEYLDWAADTTCTWLTRDGGLTWIDVAPHAAIYEFGDHGSVILIAKHEAESPTDHVLLSIDQGTCWRRVDLPISLDIQNIRMEPSGRSHIFAVHGQECRKTVQHPNCSLDAGEMRWPKGLLYMLDVNDTMRSDWKVCGDDDYEEWSAPNPETCLLGQNYTWTRVKAESECYNKERWERAESITPCDCSHVDLECEFGFERQGNSSECLPMVDIDPGACPAIVQGGYYMSESHMRLVHNDTCAHVERVLLDSDGMGHCVGDNCPGGGGSQGGGGGQAERHHLWRTVLVLLVGTLAVVGMGIWWTRYASDGVKATAEELMSPVLACCGGCTGWAQDKFALLTGRQRRVAEAAYYDPLTGNDNFDLTDEDARSPPLFPMGSR